MILNEKNIIQPISIIFLAGSLVQLHFTAQFQAMAIGKPLKLPDGDGWKFTEFLIGDSHLHSGLEFSIVIRQFSGV